MKFLLLATLASLAAARPDDPYRPQQYKEPARPYSYSYAVEDPYHGTQFNAEESSDGGNVKGSYQVRKGKNGFSKVINNHFHRFNCPMAVCRR